MVDRFPIYAFSLLSEIAWGGDWNKEDDKKLLKTLYDIC